LRLGRVTEEDLLDGEGGVMVIVTAATNAVTRRRPTVVGETAVGGMASHAELAIIVDR